MRRKVISLLIGVVLLVGLFAVYKTMQNKPDDSTAETNTDETITLLDKSDGDIKTFSISSNDKTLSFVPSKIDGETFWQLADEKRVGLDSYSLSSLTRSVTKVVADKVAVEKSEDLSQFGLYPPKATATVEFSDGEKHNILIGSLTPDKSFYYFMFDDKPSVYLLQKINGEPYSFQFADVIDKKIAPIAKDKLTYAYIKNKDGVVEISHPGTEQELRMDLATYGIASLVMKQPFQNRDVYLTDFAEDVLVGVDALNFTDLVEIGASDLGKYGLDQPELEIKLKDDSAEMSLLIGSDAGNGQVYARTAENTNVFTIPSASFDKFRKINVFTFIDRFVTLRNVETVEKIVVDKRGKKTEIVPNKEVLPAKEGQTDGEVVYKPTVDGVSVTEDAFKKYYQTLISISFDSVDANAVVSGEPDVTITFVSNDKSPSSVAKYYSYNNDFYAVGIDGNAPQFLVSKQNVKVTEDMLEKLKSGKLNE